MIFTEWTAFSSETFCLWQGRVLLTPRWGVWVGVSQHPGLGAGALREWERPFPEVAFVSWPYFTAVLFACPPPVWAGAEFSEPRGGSRKADPHPNPLGFRWAHPHRPQWSPCWRRRWGRNESCVRKGSILLFFTFWREQGGSPEKVLGGANRFPARPLH